LAILESSYLTALRTGLAGALGAGALALPSAERAAITGAGVQGRSQLAALRMVRSVASVRVFDLSGDAARRFLADPACAGLGACASSMDDALDDAQIVITANLGQGAALASAASETGHAHHDARPGSAWKVRGLGRGAAGGPGCRG